ncbi:hypothetical protein [Agathobaculum desmolans]|uniref:hypothetical protein n=1 Tax=Agathobaculum desmolans TaxID=39484 RepID=UPI00248F36A9|nr:hypothetical protein [Agathobaculum desmolans]
MPDALHLHLRPCDIAVIRYHEQDNELVELRFRIGQEREAQFALTHISAYDPDYNAIFSSRFRKKLQRRQRHVEKYTTIRK